MAIFVITVMTERHQSIEPVISHYLLLKSSIYYLS